MIHTASWFNKQDWKGISISVSLSTPKGLIADTELSCFKPTWDIVRALQANTITWEEYKDKYIAILNRVDIDFSTLNNGEHTLLCWEKTPERCHRSLLAGWLKEKDIDVGQVR